MVFNRLTALRAFLRFLGCVANRVGSLRIFTSFSRDFVSSVESEPRHWGLPDAWVSRDPPLGGWVLRAFQDENKAGQIQHQNMTSLSVWLIAKVDAWGSADPVSSGAGNFAGWDWLSWVCSIIHLCFVQFFSAFTPFSDVYFIKFRRLFYINHCVINISGSII